jgi:hypothetical protein
MQGTKVARFTMLRGLVTAVILAVLITSSPQLRGAPQPVRGTLLVTRSTYEGTAATVAFPGLLPNNSASTSDGTFPGVFNNETPDGSFGVTSPVLVDQLTPTGGLLRTLNVTNAISTQSGLNVATSFSSKSEMGLNITPDGSAVTFMAYGAPSNALDVSNASTPGHVDITDPVNGRGILINQRNIIELGTDWSLQVTRTNTYSGNNGRNVALGSNGVYYTAGNAGNNGKSATFAAGTVSFVSGSNAITLSGASSTANMYVGTPFSGTSIPVGAFVTAITSPTQFTISATTTSTPAGAYVANEGAVQLTGVSFSTSSSIITVSDTSKLVPGMPLNGAGFATGSFIQSVTNATHFVANLTPTASSSSLVSYTASVSNSMLSDNTGVQMIAKGENDTTGTGTGILDAISNSTVVGKVNGVFGTATGYQRGFTISQIGAANDKTGKDDNFRGLTIFKDTVYVTKGSGGNGFDAVYQVNPAGGAYVTPGSSAGLATAANAATASINPLPGWPTTSTGANESSKVTTPIVFHPFGIWFANDTTLYVADEGASGVLNAAVGGLQKWTYNSGTAQWELKYTIPASSIPSYTVSGVGTLQAEGLRNISAVDNGDGTVRIYAITSTTGQTLNDEGADPNQLVAITDTLAATSLPAESFDVIETAKAGDVLRGVAFMVDNTPPVLTCRATPNQVWPPNNKLVPVSVAVTVSDTGSGTDGSFTLVSATSNEPDGGSGDIQGFTVGTASTSGSVRASRLGSGNGRIYTFTYQASDRAGNTATCSTTVRVPHDQGK